VTAQRARIVAIVLLRLGFTIRDVAELLRAHERAVVALLA
jgi:hypothetical protein